VIVPDGILNVVPFDALPEVDGGVLGDRLRIETRNTTWELLFEERPSADEVTTFLAIGDLDYGTPAADPSQSTAHHPRFVFDFLPLPRTRDEISGIAREFRDTHPQLEPMLLSGRDANRERFALSASGATYLHLATHGWFAPETVRSSGAASEPIDKALGAGRYLTVKEKVLRLSPMVLCGVALSGANDAPVGTRAARGIFLAEELASLDLRRCSLAVLSACETHAGMRRPGQGVSSLQKAMHLAGARSVITSLWKVSDEAAASLMLEFYRGLWTGGMTKADALWKAKRALRERGRPPGDWAAWVLTGDPR
jgi:CHAT domain-containing protein